MLMVLLAISGLAFFTLPKFSGLYERNQLTSARQEIEAAIATARAAAIQKGRPARLLVSSNQLLVTVTSATGGQTTIIPLKPLDSLYRVSVTTTDSAIVYDSRGFASPRLSATAKFRLIGTTRRDSVCVTPAGQIMPRSCAL
jgi:Tfp pilus assembly protein FimT